MGNRTIVNSNFYQVANTDANLNITGITTNSLSSITLNTTISNIGNVGNVKIGGGSNGQILTVANSANGLLSWSAPTSGTSIANGNSNISIDLNGNVTFGVSGTANVITVGNAVTTIRGILDLGTDNDSNIIAIGSGAATFLANGNIITGSDIIAIGGNAAGNATGNNIIAIGTAIVGYTAAVNAVGNNIIALGDSAVSARGNNIISIGTACWNANANNIIGIGYSAAENLNGTSVIAIGDYAGFNANVNNSIILNSSGTYQNAVQSNSFYVNPIRANLPANAQFLYYDANSKEITYSNVFGNINTTNIVVTNPAQTGRIGVAASNTGLYIGPGLNGSPVVTTEGFINLYSNGSANFYQSPSIILGNVSNLHISGGNSGDWLTTNGNGNLSWSNTFSNIRLTIGSTPEIGTIINSNGIFIGSGVPLSESNAVFSIRSNGVASFAGANVSLGNVSNLHITGGGSGQFLQTDGAGNLSWTNPPTPVPGGITIGTTYIPVNSSAPSLTGLTTVSTGSLAASGSVTGNQMTANGSNVYAGLVTSAAYGPNNAAWTRTANLTINGVTYRLLAV